MHASATTGGAGRETDRRGIVSGYSGVRFHNVPRKFLRGGGEGTTTNTRKAREVVAGGIVKGSGKNAGWSKDAVVQKKGLLRSRRTLQGWAHARGTTITRSAND